MSESSPNGVTRRVAERGYRGIWVVLRDWFRVPEAPPSLPVPPTGVLQSFRPSEGYLRYLTLGFWIFVVVLNGAILIAWLTMSIAAPVAGLIFTLPAVALAIVPDVLSYVALRLRYDTTWYVLSDRSIRIRRGIWIIEEVTITFENVQNVSVAQGPVQRYFGIADVTIQTAGGGGAGPNGVATGGHMGIIEGISNAEQMRDAILAKVRASRHAGLGDEHHHDIHPAATGLGAAHLAMLRDIRDAVRAMPHSA